jgi:cell division septum initiation protein DivIVA
MKTKTKRAFKANKLSDTCDKALPTTRRSIPVKEVDEMIDRAVARVKSERTIYDDRNELLQRISDVECNLEYHESSVHNCEKTLLSLKAELNKTNTAIARELDLDSLR